MPEFGPPQPGWYEDPDDPKRSRWWTGAEWGPRSAGSDAPDGVAAPRLGEEPPNSFETLAQESTATPRDGDGAFQEEGPSAQLGHGEQPSRREAAPASAPTRSPGWFPDPRDPDRLRYWDGSDWDDSQSIVGPTEPAQSGVGAPDSIATEMPQSSENTARERKPLTEAEEKQLKPGSKEWGLLVLSALGFGAGALAGIRLWVAVVVAIIAAGAIVARNDLLYRSPRHADPVRSDGLQLSIFGAIWLIIVILFTVGSSSPPDDVALQDNGEQEQSGHEEATDAGSDDGLPTDADVEQGEGTVEEAPVPEESDEPLTLPERINQSLSPPNRDVSFLTENENSRVVLIEDGQDLLALVALNDNLSNRLIRSAAQRDTARIAEEAQKEPEFVGTLTVSLSFPLIDQFGNAEETIVATVTYRRETLDRMNFSNILPENFWDLADARQVHPVFSE
jgi:hypothetical protein